MSTSRTDYLERRLNIRGGYVVLNKLSVMLRRHRFFISMFFVTLVGPSALKADMLFNSGDALPPMHLDVCDDLAGAQEQANKMWALSKTPYDKSALAAAQRTSQGCRIQFISVFLRKPEGSIRAYRAWSPTYDEHSSVYYNYSIGSTQYVVPYANNLATVRWYQVLYRNNESRWTKGFAQVPDQPMVMAFLQKYKIEWHNLISTPKLEEIAELEGRLPLDSRRNIQNSNPQVVPARVNDLMFCNATETDLYTAIAYYATPLPNTDRTVEGWWPLAARECKVIKILPDDREIYAHAISSDGRFKWRGILKNECVNVPYDKVMECQRIADQNMDQPRLFCVNAKKFIYSEDACDVNLTPEEKDCLGNKMLWGGSERCYRDGRSLEQFAHIVFNGDNPEIRNLLETGGFFRDGNGPSSEKNYGPIMLARYTLVFVHSKN